jgi:hypothetical protein
MKCDRVTVSNSPEGEVYKDVNRSDRRRLETIAAEELADADHAESS